MIRVEFDELAHIFPIFPIFPLWTEILNAMEGPGPPLRPPVRQDRVCKIYECCLRANGNEWQQGPGDDVRFAYRTDCFNTVGRLK